MRGEAMKRVGTMGREGGRGKGKQKGSKGEGGRYGETEGLRK